MVYETDGINHCGICAACEAAQLLLDDGLCEDCRERQRTSGEEVGVMDNTLFPEPGYVYAGRNPGVGRRLSVRNRPDGRVIYRRELPGGRWSGMRFCSIATWRAWVSDQPAQVRSDIPIQE